MAKLGKRLKASHEKVDREKRYNVTEAINLAVETATAKYDESIDVSVRLGVDPKQSDQQVRGAVSLPHGLGKDVRVIVFAKGPKEAEAKEAGADYVGLDEYITKIKEGWTDIDVIISTPNVMGKIGALGRVLGPRGLMPNPKTGTVTMDVAKAITDVKGGKIDFKVDKTGIVPAAIGKASFTADKIAGNAKELLETLNKLKPTSSKGVYMKSVFMSSTMSPSVQLDPKTV